MGFHDSTHAGNKVYASITRGKIVLSSREAREGFTQRINKAGNTVYEQEHGAFTGYLVDVSVYEADWGTQWNFVFRDSADATAPQVVMTAKLDSAYAKSLLNSLCNPAADLSLPVTVTPYLYEKDGKQKAGTTVTQRGQKIAWQYTRDNGLPPMMEIKVKGEVVWDSTEIIEFFKAKVDTEIKARIDKPVAPAVVETSSHTLPF